MEKMERLEPRRALDSINWPVGHAHHYPASERVARMSMEQALRNTPREYFTCGLMVGLLFGVALGALAVML